MYSSVVLSRGNFEIGVTGASIFRELKNGSTIGTILFRHDELIITSYKYTDASGQYNVI